MICHNDFAPYNLAFRDGLPVGAIDFEAASPGPRAWDLAYLAYRLVPLAPPSNPDLPPQPDPEAHGSRGSAPPTETSTRPPCSRSSRRACDALAETAPPAHAALYRADAAYLRSGSRRVTAARAEGAGERQRRLGGEVGVSAVAGSGERRVGPRMPA